MNVHDYLIDHSDLNWGELLGAWHWLLPSEFSVWLLTRSGDLIIAHVDGSIQMLDVGVGELRTLAKNKAEFLANVDKPTLADEWLMIPVIDALVLSGCTLENGQCYGYRILPALGGDYREENRVPLSIREHFGVCASIHEQIAELPDGSKVTIKTTD